jgi:hypothetical protein
MKYIFLILSMQYVLFANFTRTNATVEDSQTNLQWQDDVNTSLNDWKEALNYCENLTLATFDDWRLPDINEFKTIIFRQRVAPMIKSIFQNTEADVYWSSTVYKSQASEGVWSVAFDDGSIGETEKAETGIYVRCVRGGK